MRVIHTKKMEKISADTNNYRDKLELLRSRVGLLVGKDKLLMTMHLENGNSFRQMARLAGVSEASIARKIRRLTERLLDGKYVMCLRNRDKFNRIELAIAKDYFLLGLSQRKIASEHNCSFHQIRKIIKKIREIVETAD